MKNTLNTPEDALLLAVRNIDIAIDHLTGTDDASALAWLAGTLRGIAAHCDDLSGEILDSHASAASAASAEPALD